MAWEIIKWILLGIVFIFAITALTGAPYVPSRVKELRIAFQKLYKISGKDLIVDLGSGDGIVLKIANEFGARGLGVEINPILVLATKLRFARNKDVTIRSGDLFKLDFPEDTTVVYLFGDSRDIQQMLEAIQKQADRLGHDLFLISHAFKIPNRKAIKKHRAYYLYLIKHGERQ